MDPLTLENARFLRYSVYTLLIVVSVGCMVGRIGTVRSDRGKTPFLSANDRSRWATVRALVEFRTYSIDRVSFGRTGQRNPDWYTIDLVRHRARDGREHFYSSKPPLLPTLLAAKYWLVKQVTGATLAQDPFFVARVLLITTNVLPMVLYFCILVMLVEQLGMTDWGRIYVLGTATWGTFLTTFAVTLNNHLPAAVSVLLAILAAYQTMYRGKRHAFWYVLAGLAGAFAVANELPALSFFCLLTLAFVWHAPGRTLLWYVPAAGAVAAAFFLTTYLAHGSWRPPYAHRKDGPVAVTLPVELRESLQSVSKRQQVLDSLRSAGIELSPRAWVQDRPQPQRWVVWDPESHMRWALVDEGDQLTLRHWDNWYDYQGSYWLPGNVRGVDRGETSRWVYAFHVLVGHHGVFSLTPVWILSLVGMVLWIRRGETTVRWFAAMVLLLTVVCLAFYLARPLSDRNYGGVASGFRWVFWCTPLWLLTLLPAADALSQSRRGRTLAWILLAISTISTSYALLNPWSHPWLYAYWSYLGWVQP